MTSKIIKGVMDWAKAAQKTAVWVVFGISCLLSLASVGIFVYDVLSSYYGWGHLVVELTALNVAPELLGATLALLPTLIQVAYFTSLVSGLTQLSRHTIFAVLSAVMFVFDSILDFAALYTGGLDSALFSLAVVLIVYGLLSEVLFSFFFPISVALGTTLVGEMDFGFTTSPPLTGLGRGSQQGHSQPPVGARR